jgi:hypothetical protein
MSKYNKCKGKDSDNNLYEKCYREKINGITLQTKKNSFILIMYVTDSLLHQRSKNESLEFNLVIAQGEN